MNHDVAIVGGGLVGLGLACALGQSGLRVALVEANPFDSSSPDSTSTASTARPDSSTGSGGRSSALEHPALDLRVSAITRASQAWMHEMGVWEQLPPDRQCAFERMVVWDAGSSGEVCFDAADLGLQMLGTIVENRALQRVLEARLAWSDTVRYYRPETVTQVEFGQDQVLVHLERTRLRARLLVGADGAQSLVRRLAGIECQGGDFSQRAVVANFTTQSGHRDTAWQRFLADGPIALLPLPCGQVSMVWSTNQAHAQELEALSERELAAAVEDAIEGRVWGLRCAGPSASFPLRYHDAVRYVDHRVALVGDAAHGIHPLAGQGVNLGLMDAAVLAEVLDGLAQRGRDPGRVENIRAYQRRRVGQNRGTGLGMRAFHQVFTSAAAPVRAARGLGFDLADRFLPLKQQFIRYATGAGGDLPRAVRKGLERLAAE